MLQRSHADALAYRAVETEAERLYVFAICEPLQFQEVISYIILGSSSALLFDAGLDIGKINRIVTRRSKVRSSRRPFAGACRRASTPRPIGPAPSPPTQFIKDGHTIDLGGRRLTVLHVPGHTPDAVALVDAAAGLLFTGDSFYEGTIWLYVPETDLAVFAASVDRLAAMVPNLKRLHPSHNVAVSAPESLSRLKVAIRQVRSGQAKGVENDNGQITFSFEGFKILTSRAALAGRRGDPTRGGSGLDVPAMPK